jgi:hypothetical protein
MREGVTRIASIMRGVEPIRAQLYPYRWTTVRDDTGSGIMLLQATCGGNARSARETSVLEPAARLADEDDPRQIVGGGAPHHQ